MSKRSNRIKDRLLGMSHGTANGRLRKQIIFWLVQKLAKYEPDWLVCYRCKKEIRNIHEISIEHKNSWQQAKDPISSFFDMDNIAFSHLSCNYAAATPVRKKYFTDAERRAARVRDTQRCRKNLGERMKIQFEICNEKHGVEHRKGKKGNYIGGCIKDGKTVFPGPGCKNIYGTCKFFNLRKMTKQNAAVV